MKKELLSIVFGFLFVGSLEAASFDCKKASTFIENAICQDSELSRLDDELSIAYKKMWKTQNDKTNLKNDQFAWIKEDRDKCLSIDCLKISYSNRIKDLEKFASFSQNSTTNSDIFGLFETKNATIGINKDLSFVYSSVEPVSAHICEVEDEKFTKQNDTLVWNSSEVECKISLAKISEDSIKLSSIGDGCYTYCGARAYIEEGVYKRSKSSKQQTQEKKETMPSQTNKHNSIPANNISPKGKLADMYNLGSNYTDIQRDNMTKELKGKQIIWELPVYEVSKISNGKYRISTGTGELFGDSYVSASIKLTARNSNEVNYIESLMTGNKIKIQGIISDVFLRTVQIEQAILY
jgi:uncharacterized protein